MENTSPKTSMVVVTIIALLIGLSAGLMYGKTKGKEEGRAMLLAEQEAAAVAAQEELLEPANPFADSGEANPLEGSYENLPEDGVINPLAQ